MVSDGYLQVSGISTGAVRNIAQQCNTETDNDIIDTQDEWKGFLSGLANSYGSGEINYDETKEYLDASSSLFIENNRTNTAYVNGYNEGLDFIHESDWLPFFRTINNVLSPGAAANCILGMADNAELMEKTDILIEETDKILEETDKLLGQ